MSEPERLRTLLQSTGKYATRSSSQIVYHRILELRYHKIYQVQFSYVQIPLTRLRYTGARQLNNQVSGTYVPTDITPQGTHYLTYHTSPSVTSACMMIHEMDSRSYYTCICEYHHTPRTTIDVNSLQVTIKTNLLAELKHQSM